MSTCSLLEAVTIQQLHFEKVLLDYLFIYIFIEANDTVLHIIVKIQVNVSVVEKVTLKK